jgi:mannose/fructose-specific phosphotransferase system component IIA
LEERWAALNQEQDRIMADMDALNPTGNDEWEEEGGVIVCIDLMGGSICIRATKIHLKFGLHVVEIS